MEYTIADYARLQKGFEMNFDRHIIRLEDTLYDFYKGERIRLRNEYGVMCNFMLMDPHAELLFKQINPHSKTGDMLVEKTVLHIIRWFIEKLMEEPERLRYFLTNIATREREDFFNSSFKKVAELSVIGKCAFAKN